MGEQISVKDKKILYELDSNARQPISSIAKKVGLKKETVSYRIKRMRKTGLIGKYFTVIDTYKLGYTMCTLFLRFNNISLEKEAELIKFLRARKCVGAIANIHGAFDLAIRIWVKSLQELQRVIDHIIYNYGTFLSDKYLSIANVMHPLKKRFLYQCFDVPGYTIGKDTTPVRPDKTDMRILSLLNRSARITNASIAKILNLTPNAVKYRINKLQKAGIILGYKIGISSKMLGYQRYKVFLLLQNITKKDKQRLIELLKTDPNTNEVIDSIGRYDLEFEIDLRDSTQLNRFLRKLRSEFPQMIGHFEVMLVYRKTDMNYLPMLEYKEEATK